MDKTAQLKDALSQLSRTEAMAVARAVEARRLAGQEELPTEAILASLRPHLRSLRPPRVPTVQRLVCRACEDFLTDHADEPRRPGLVPRAVLAPWWQGVNRLCADAIKPFADELRRLVAAGDEAGIERLTPEAQRAALGWTERLLAELRHAKGDAALRKRFAEPLLVADLREIATLLKIAEPLRTAMDAVLALADGDRKLDGQCIAELTPAAVTMAKQQYQALNDLHGLDSRYFALALLNRLKRPGQILRLGRALSWKPNDALVRDTEFGIVGQRLILDLQHLSREIVALVSNHGRPPAVAALAERIERYMDEAEGLLDEFGFRRDSPWGEAILQTRTDVAAALDRGFLDHAADRVLDVMPPARRPGMRRGLDDQPDLGFTPDPDTVEAALQAARFLMLLQQRGSRHGLGHAARARIDRLGERIEERASSLLGELRLAPDSPAIVAQLEAAAQACDVMFDEKRGQLLLRRMRIACQTPA